MDSVQEAEKRTGKMFNAQSQRIDQEISQSLEELIPKIEVLQSEFK